MRYNVSNTRANLLGRKAHAAAGEKLLIHAKEELGESEYLNMAVGMAAYEKKNFVSHGNHYIGDC